MKIPKFIKNSKSSRSVSGATKFNNYTNVNSNQLLLTESNDSFARFQPQKKINSATVTPASVAMYKDVLFTTPSSKNNQSQVQCSPNVVKNLFQLKQVDASLSTPTGQNISIVNYASSGRYAKAGAQPKRLQRNRLHVEKKPANYLLRSALTAVNTTPIRPCLVQIQNTSSKKIANNNKTNNGIKKYDSDYSDRDEDDEDDQEDNELELNINSNKSTPKFDTKSTKSSNTNTPVSQNRFSFSRLTKFVSKSALKVIGRKSLNGNDKESTSLNNSPAQMQVDEPAYNSNIYTSYEQQQQFEMKLNKKYGNRYVGVNKSRPVMGVTSVMLKQFKRNNANQYGLMTTGVCTSVPSLYLTSIPIIFNSEMLVDDNNTYDHLDRPVVTNLTQNKPKNHLSTPSKMSIFSTKSLISCTRANDNELQVEQQLYESFSQAVF